eukprot:TRINITY_DN676_c0_g1_i12.p1 TRINITY_DN676_c0_g1~~TRINITY_DN676_c0_g1_i12.p1  ORF type:complete len:149 (-),score=31.11 TRINITY_DN676_c0_g1_i12:416-862(-)
MTCRFRNICVFKLVESHSPMKGTSMIDRDLKVSKHEAKLNKVRESHNKAETYAHELEKHNAARMNARVEAFRALNESYEGTCQGHNDKPKPKRFFLNQADFRAHLNQYMETHGQDAYDGSRLSTTGMNQRSREEMKVSQLLRSIASYK